MQAEGQAGMQAQAYAKSEAEARAGAKTKAYAKSKAEAGAYAKSKAEAGAYAKSEAESGAGAEAGAEAKTKAEAQAKDGAEAKAQAQVKSKTQAEAQVEAQVKSKVKAQVKSKTQAQAQAKSSRVFNGQCARGNELLHGTHKLRALTLAPLLSRDRLSLTVGRAVPQRVKRLESGACAKCHERGCSKQHGHRVQVAARANLHDKSERGSARRPERCIFCVALVRALGLRAALRAALRTVLILRGYHCVEYAKHERHKRCPVKQEHGSLLALVFLFFVSARMGR
jgi:hypothetical protein